MMRLEDLSALENFRIMTDGRKTQTHETSGPSQETSEEECDTEDTFAKEINKATVYPSLQYIQRE
ncbi:hypothetical protein [Candidatus Nitronereus thalassa]|uniref:Uncharacterized protein n=1 Tax=Candidatus Nitronereus thalassa TaxID=3020898 RepID=A0ABU3K929_9BACT|nr:hypothetical protein [Candidatus Nitronereus thalassa]MDT7042793.1 hypothetical protein [Candidatus Nitronereus thalassa]